MKSAKKPLKNSKNAAAGAVAAPATTPDQWVALAALVDSGGYEAAAEALGRSPSAVAYQVGRLQRSLRCGLLQLRGRRAVLTSQGEVLLARARNLLGEWRSLEALARVLERGSEATVRLVVDKAFPQSRLVGALLGLRRRHPRTEVDLSDAVLSGAEEAIVDGSADVVVTSRVPPGFLGDWVQDTTFVAVASPAHALATLGREATARDLARHQQVVLRDSGRREPRSEGYLGASQRWTVAGFDASVAIIEAGLAYAWLPEEIAREPLARRSLVRLRLEAGATRTVPLYVVLPRPAQAGPVARAALALLRP